MFAYSKRERDWIFERAFIRSNSYFVDFVRKFLRVLHILLCMPRVFLTQSTFDFITISGKPGMNMKKCLVCSKNSNRILNIHKNTLIGFHVFDMHIGRAVHLPNFERVFSIIRQSLASGFYSIDKVAEIYDFNACKHLAKEFDFFAASDGATPLSRSMCHIFNALEKGTFRIVTHADGPKLDKWFSYNFLTENFNGEVVNGWTKIKGFPWTKSSAKTESSVVVGVIGEPGSVRLFGIEYWMLVLARRLKRDGFAVRVRLHPQSYRFSNYLIKMILRIDTSENEDEYSFIVSCKCLLSSYRSTILDLAVASGVSVVLDSRESEKSPDRGYKKGVAVNLQGDYKQIKQLINDMPDCKHPIQPSVNSNPSIKDVVLIHINK